MTFSSLSYFHGFWNELIAVTVKQGGWTALMGAAENGRKDVVQYLLDAKADVNQGSWVWIASLLISFLTDVVPGKSSLAPKMSTCLQEIFALCLNPFLSCI